MKLFSLKSLFYFLILLVVFLFIYPLIFDAKIFLGGDNANYYILANGLASGEGYVAYHAPSSPAANHFPPGYPFIMSLIIRLGYDSLEAMKVLNGALLMLSSFLMFHIAMKLTKNNILSIILAAFVLFNRNLLEYSTIVMSETSFLFFLLLTVYLFLVYKDKLGNWKSPYFYLFGAALIVLIYIRTQGVVVLLAFTFYFLLLKQWKEAAILFTFCFLALLPWQIRSSNLGGSTYMAQLMRVEPYNGESPQMKIGDWGTRIKENVVRYISKEIPNALFPSMKVTYKDPKTGEWTPAPVTYWIVGFLVILLALLGIWSIPEHRIFFFLLFAGIFSILMLWPQVWFGIRFYLPMLPLTYMFAVLGLMFLFTKIFKLKSPLVESKRIALLCVVFLFFQIGQIKALQLKAEVDHPKNWSNFLLMGNWCKENIDENSVISSRKPALMYAASKMKSTGFLYSKNREEFFAHLDKDGVTHVIMEQLGFNQTALYLYPAMQMEREKFQLVKQYGTRTGKDKNGKQLNSKVAVWCFEYHPELGYNGEYKDGLRHGKGTYKYKEGSVMTGVWENDTLNGPGVLVNKDGIKYEGLWQKGLRQGKILITPPNGQKIESFAKNDTILPEGYILDEQGNRVRQIRIK
jgi:hypothetical protein